MRVVVIGVNQSETLALGEVCIYILAISFE